jgi:hypothetical protein
LETLQGLFVLAKVLVVLGNQEQSVGNISMLRVLVDPFIDG